MRNLEEFFLDKGADNYVERLDKDGNYISESSKAKLKYNPKKNKTELENAVIDVDALPVQAPVETPIEPPPTELKSAEPPKPTGDVQYTSPPIERIREIVKTPSHKPTEDPWWHRALIGATPLLVGLLTGNTLEGVSTSGNYFVNEESDRYKRNKDLNQKLAELQMRRDLATTKEAELKSGKLFEYQGSDGINRLGRFINNQVMRDEVNDPLAPIDEKSVKPEYKAMIDEKTGRPHLYELFPGQAPKKLKAIEPKFMPQYKQLPTLTANGEIKYQTIVDNQSTGFLPGLVPEKAKSGLTLEERLKLQENQKRLKQDEINFNRERGLNKDREGIKTTINTREIAEAHGKIMESSFGKDPVSDVATIFALFKMLDPRSVVRESEQALGIAARSYDDLVDNVAPIIMKQRTLTPKQVSNIRRLAQNIYKNQLKIQNQADSAYVERAKKYGLDPEAVAPRISSPYVESEIVRIQKGNSIFKVPAEHVERLKKEDPSIEVIR